MLIIGVEKANLNIRNAILGVENLIVEYFLLVPHFDQSAWGKCGEYINRSIFEKFAFRIADKILSPSKPK